MVLKSLATFLQQALSILGDESSDSSSSWYMRSAFASTRAHRTFYTLFETSLASGPSNVVWKPSAAHSDEHFVGTFPLTDAGADNLLSLQELSGLLSGASKESDSSSTRLKHISVCSLFSFHFPSLIHSKRLAHTLHPIIIATFLDCAPAAFGLDSTNSVELELIASVANVSRSVYGAILQGDSLVRSPHLPASRVLILATGKFEKRFERAECLAWTYGGLLPVHCQRG